MRQKVSNAYLKRYRWQFAFFAFVSILWRFIGFWHSFLFIIVFWLIQPLNLVRSRWTYTTYRLTKWHSVSISFSLVLAFFVSQFSSHVLCRLQIKSMPFTFLCKFVSNEIRHFIPFFIFQSRFQTIFFIFLSVDFFFFLFLTSMKIFNS